jgi:hypothetical protein
VVTVDKEEQVEMEGPQESLRLEVRVVQLVLQELLVLYMLEDLLVEMTEQFSSTRIQLQM